MLEVLSAAAGAACYGAMRGYLSLGRSQAHLRVFAAHALVAGVCAYDVARRAKERDSSWRISGRTCESINDSIDSNSPKYFVQNIPLFIGTYASSFTLVGTLRKLLSYHVLSFI